MEMQTQTPIFTVTDSRESVANAIRAAGELVKLDRRRGWAELNALFKSGATPSRSLDGPYDGRLIALDFGPGLTQFLEGATSLYLPWRGKFFDAARRRGINIFDRKS